MLGKGHNSKTKAGVAKVCTGLLNQVEHQIAAQVHDSLNQEMTAAAIAQSERSGVMTTVEEITYFTKLKMYLKP